MLPLATSLDGRRFSFQASLHGLACGSAVRRARGRRGRGSAGAELEPARPRARSTSRSRSSCGARMQVAIRHAVGEAPARRLARPFRHAAVRPATADEVAKHCRRLSRCAAGVTVGELLLARRPISFDAGGFGRHTFLCGQSGSGKSLSLGVVLERLLIETDLRIVVLDPNSDFVRLDEPDAGEPGRRARLALRDRSCGSGVEGAAPGAALPRSSTRRRERPPCSGSTRRRPRGVRGAGAVVEAATPAASRTSRRGARGALAADAPRHNLGLDRWGIWAREGTGSVSTTWEETSAASWSTSDRCDPGGAPQAGAGLAALWRRRADREPMLIVVDEAHNVCPAARPTR